MNYSIQAHPTVYRGIEFRSRLEATWAAFFDCFSAVSWQYEPIDLPGWTPDFSLSVRVPGLIDLSPSIQLLASVKPYSDVIDFKSDFQWQSVCLKYLRGEFSVIGLGTTPDVATQPALRCPCGLDDEGYCYFNLGSILGAGCSVLRPWWDKGCWQKEWNLASNNTRWHPN